MLGLLFPLGLISITGYVDSSKELHWMASVFSGIILCNIVYKSTGHISRLCFNGYEKLSNAEKVEWNNRGFSTIHAVVVAIASLYVLLFSGLFNGDSHDELIISRVSTLSDTILGISLGYFLSDLAMIFWQFPALGGMEYVLHHGLSMFSIFLSLVSGQGQIYILMVLFSEITTPFVNLRWYLDVANQKNSNLYVCNGLALFLGWLVARVLLFIFFFIHMFFHFDQVVDLVKRAIPIALTPENDPTRDELKKLHEMKEEIDVLAHKQVRCILWTGLGFSVVQVGLFFRLTFWEFSWDVMEPIAFFTTATGIVIGYAYFLFTSRDPTYQDLMKRLFLSRQRKLFKKRNFDIVRLRELHRKCKTPLDATTSIKNRVGVDLDLEDALHKD